MRSSKSKITSIYSWITSTIRIIYITVAKMLEQLTVVQSDLVEKIARKNGFDRYNLEISSGSEKGDNYLGVITKVTIKNDERKMDLILKSASTNEAFRKSAPVYKMFCREIHIYDRIFVEFQKFQQEFNIPDPFLAHAKFYGKCDEELNECLIMENLIESGYKMWDRKKPMDPEHISAVLREYGKFHAVSIAMRHKKPDSFGELTEDIAHHILKEQMDNKTKAEAYVKGAVGSGLEAVSNDPVFTELLHKFSSGLPEYLTNIAKDPELEMVITHGDCWCNNIMFKYEGSVTPSKVAFLDWQISKIGSPAADLVYFFLSHSPKEVLYDYKSYLKLYHDTVCKNLRDFSCDPETVYPYSLLEYHWKRLIKVGLYVALIIVKVMCCDKKDALDLREKTDSDRDLVESLSIETKNTEEYNRRIKVLLQFLVDEKLLDL